MPQPLDVIADLNLDVNGEDVQVRGQGERIVVELPSLQAGRDLFNTDILGHGGRDMLNRMGEALQQADLTAEVKLEDTTVARLGRDAEPGAVTRLLGLGNVEVHPARSLAASASPRATGAAVAGLVGIAGLVTWFFLRRRD